MKISFLSMLLLTTILISACTPKSDNNYDRLDKDNKGDNRPLANEVDPDKIENWFTKGPNENVEGVDAERAYKELKINLNAKDVVVAVIDSGVDINHEDLQGKIWTNEKEAHGKSGIDDDGNGYVDDIHGWNYLGGYDTAGNPTHVNEERLEVTREAARLRKLQAELAQNNQNLSAEDEILFKQVTTELSEARESMEVGKQASIKSIDAILPNYEILKNKLTNIEFILLTIEDIEKLVLTDANEIAARDAILKEFKDARSKSIQRFRLRISSAEKALQTQLNESFDPRKDIVKNDSTDFTALTYGNNDVAGPDPSHGTHVAGIITANRNNGLGVDGIAQSVKIMVLRAVPNGDEYDKDIYLAVKYAVDNGARIINMSFGKDYSPFKTKVDEAFKYAADHDVIVVHAAGNSALDIDVANNFPNRYVKATGLNDASEISTWIEVGASSRYNDQRLTAVFSNYGKKSVDLFAPGFEIKSTTPGNTYAVYSGTSMACPAAAGVVALAMSQRPDLSGAEIRDLVINSSRDKSQLQVLTPGTATLVPFAQLSRTGSLADIYATLKKLINLL